MLGELLFKVYAQKEYALYIFVILTSLNLLFRSDCESWDRGGKGDDDVGALVSLKVQHSLCVTSLRLFRLVLYATSFTAATPLSLVKKIGANDITMRLTNA
jgi:hypothetical protein